MRSWYCTDTGAISCIYRVLIKYCVFYLKCCDFSELCQFCCSVGVEPAWCCKTPEWFEIFEKKNTISNEHPVYVRDIPSVSAIPRAHIQPTRMDEAVDSGDSVMITKSWPCRKPKLFSRQTDIKNRDEDRNNFVDQKFKNIPFILSSSLVTPGWQGMWSNVVVQVLSIDKGSTHLKTK